MDLWCTLRYDDCGEKKIILPNEAELQSLQLVLDNESQNKKIETKLNLQDVGGNSYKCLGPVINIPKIAHLIHQNIERLENKNQYSIGNSIEIMSVGPVLQVIHRSTFAEISDNKLVFVERNPIASNGRYAEQRDNKIGITPGQDDGKDLLILAIKEGCVIVRAGGFLICDLPIVLVKSNGEYTTLSAGPRNLLRLKSGSHFAILAKLGIPVPILFMRQPEKIVHQIKANNKSPQKTTNESSVSDQESDESLKLNNKN